HIVTASDDKTAKIWEVASGSCIATLTGHTDSVRSAQFNPAGTQIVTASHDGTAKIWDVSSLIFLSSLFSNEDLFTLPQAYVLDQISRVISERSQNKNALFDFTTCPHLQEEYDQLLAYYIENKLCAEATRTELHSILDP